MKGGGGGGGGGGREGGGGGGGVRMGKRVLGNERGKGACRHICSASCGGVSVCLQSPTMV